MEVIGIIPARWASSRFPGKPLAMIGGKPMIERVYVQARKALDKVVVATDDPRIYDCVKGFGGEVVMTRTDHRCGTERCLEAYGKMKNDPQSPWYKQLHGLSDNEIIVVNIQGDEPFIQPQQITALCGLFTMQSAQNNASATEIATLVRPFRKTDTWEALSNPNTPKVVFSNTDRHAILFSRSVIPYLRGIPQSQWLEKECHYGHIGMYAYRGDVLGRIVLFPPSPLEQAESLEQLRWLENGITIRVAVSEQQSIGIDTPEDLQKANRLIIDNK